MSPCPPMFEAIRVWKGAVGHDVMTVGRDMPGPPRLRCEHILRDGDRRVLDLTSSMTFSFSFPVKNSKK